MPCPTYVSVESYIAGRSEEIPSTVPIENHCAIVISILASFINDWIPRGTSPGAPIARDALGLA